ncbi:flagellar basal body P-ring formation chaperone FlgA [Aquabacterium sp.]|uniref:flagellar basal body P-ring formation chaperone FlgA n=1 Tax=Aquabacterium sp. TaxID=1872578 RepID=UPI002B6624BB|nr:flagellar basal body P-ring formation chaperone FlgA [Aquabacterium sp.]HSW06354.1 flagellar basal body P-ring formation chaperone FlgA [Aquabacterium sp.]
MKPRLPFPPRLGTAAVGLVLMLAWFTTATAGALTDPCEMAERFVNDAAAAAAGLSVTVRCRLPEADRVRAEHGQWRLAEPIPALLSGAGRIVVSVLASGRAVQRIAVPVQLELRSAAWVASRNLLAGERLGTGDTELREIAWPTGQRPTVGGDTAPTGRARRAIAAGDPVSSAQLLGENTVAFGDPVSVSWASPALAIQAAGVLVTPGRVGDIVRVQLKDRRVTLEGRLVDASSVEILP